MTDTAAITRFSIFGKRRRYAASWLVPALVTALSVGASLGAWLHIRHTEEEEQLNNLTSEIALISVELRDRLRAHGHFLRGVRAFIETTPGVSPAQWTNYSQRLDMERHAPGVAAYGFAERARPADAAARSVAIRQQYRLAALPPAFVQSLDDHYIVRNVAPQSEYMLRGTGFDLYGESKRRNTIEQARDTDDVAMTGRITLAPDRRELADKTDAAAPPQPAFLMMMPVYRGNGIPHDVRERRRDIAGVVFASFRMNDFMASLNYARNGKLAMRIFDDESFNTGKESQGLAILFDTISSLDDSTVQLEEREIEFGQHRWLIQFRPKAVRPFIRESSSLLFGGLLVSLLLGALTWNQANRRRQAEHYAQAMNAELIHSEERFKLATEGNSSGLWDRELSEDKVYISERLEALLGFAPGTFTRTATFLMSRVHPDDRPAVQAAGVRHIREGAPYDFECRLLRGDGTWGWFRSCGQAIWDNTGHAVRMAGSVTDISQRKEVEEQLERYKNFLSTVIKSIPHPVFVKDKEGRFIMVNTAMCEFVKTDEQELLGRRGFDNVPLPAETAKVIRELDELVFATGQMQIGEYDLPIRGRGLRRVIARKTLAVDPEGSPIQIGTLTDVTERHAAEHTILQTSRQLQSLLDAATEIAITATDTTGLIRNFNRGAEKMLGYAAGELVGRQSAAIFHDETEISRRSAELSQQLGRPIDGFEAFVALAKVNGAEQREWTYLRKDGSRLAVSLVVTAVLDEAGELSGFLGIAIDITERRQAETELLQHRDHLQELVAEQTADLLRAKEVAERANQTKSEFLANMSHEMRTPMHAVLSFAGLGETKARIEHAEKLGHYFHRIRQSGDRLLRLLNDLLDLSKLEAGKMQIDLKLHDVRPLICEAGAELESLFASRGLHLAIADADCSTEAMCDPVRFGQVVRNLLSNAMKFSPDGGKISVSFDSSVLELGRRSDEKAAFPALRITISDQGVGIPADELETIFEKFVQSSKTKTGAGGTGLGLAICQEIMRAHRGSIAACNNSQGGASFSLQLPRAPVVFLNSTLRDAS